MEWTERARDASGKVTDGRTPDVERPTSTGVKKLRSRCRQAVENREDKAEAATLSPQLALAAQTADGAIVLVIARRSIALRAHHAGGSSVSGERRFRAGQSDEENSPGQLHGVAAAGNQVPALPHARC